VVASEYTGLNDVLGGRGIFPHALLSMTAVF
jgi:hypothetical protein